MRENNENVAPRDTKAGQDFCIDVAMQCGMAMSTALLCKDGKAGCNRCPWFNNKVQVKEKRDG